MPIFDMSYWDDPESLHKFYQRWEKIHKRGAAFFVLLWGGLVAGVLPFALVTCWDVLVGHEQMDAFVLSTFAFFWLVSGIFSGAMYWHLQERRYMRAKKLEDSISGNQPG
jgi:hypothetical protein